MNDTETPATDKISAALVKAQQEFGPALKTATNPHFRSRYADLSACVEAVIDALNNNGIALIQRVGSDAGCVTVETVFVHSSGQKLHCGTLALPATKNDAQGFGSALTYARRYSLMAACGIAPEDDDGNAASRPQAAPLRTAAPQGKPAAKPAQAAAQAAAQEAKADDSADSRIPF